MNKSFLIKNPELFQGEKYLKTNSHYFEGWYFKNTNNKGGISFIPGININNENKKAFIQVITSHSSYYINYDINDFHFNLFPFSIKIGNNFFSKEYISIDIEEEKQNIKIHGKIKYLNSQNINTNFLNPNIMGPFSYIPFMECNHAILSMKNKTQGSICINDTIIDLNNGTGYIEKDWGISFPKYYIWCQANNFKTKNTSFILSIADIPFKIFNFRGIICILKINNKEFKFSTYNNVKLKLYEVKNNYINIILKKGIYTLEINSKCNIKNAVIAPIRGEMKKNILESISASVYIVLKKRNKIIFTDKSSNCGLEIVHDK